MVSDMMISSVKQPQRAPNSREGSTADPKQCTGWLFKAGNMPSSCAKTHNLDGIIRSLDNMSSNSWETQAFDADASSLAAGIWPPRAYPCSFCRREFRSAQALGGHMNVHRRDRARLRHCSPPPSPFCVPLTTPQPISSLFPAPERYSIHSCAEYPNKSLIKLNTPPITLSGMSNIFPAPTPYRSCTDSCPCDVVTSFPLRLQQLASEAASSFNMYPQACESSDLIFTLWPTSTAKSANFACHSNISGTPMKETTMEISSSSSFSSPPSSSSIVSCAGPSATKATPCRRDAPIILLEDENPKKKSHTDSSEYRRKLSQVVKSTHDELHAADTQPCPNKKSVDDIITYSEQRRAGECSEVIDLELRLGQGQQRPVKDICS